MEKNILKAIFCMSKNVLIGLIASCFLANLVLAEESPAQKMEEVFLQVSIKDGSVSELFTAIEQETIFSFFYNKSRIEALPHRLSLDNQEYSVADVLRLVALETGLKFNQINRTISVLSDEIILPEIIPVQQTVTGRVVDQETGEALPGVNVIVMGSEELGSIIGTQTNLDGNYSINVPDGLNTLIFTYIGYQRLEVDVDGGQTINIQLETQTIAGEELVVVGYGVQRRETLTGSVSAIEGGELTKTPAPNVSNALAGRISGIVANNRSGEPGHDGSSINIRGVSTLGNNSPLVVIDGVPGQLGGLDRIDPHDIESISVIKDATAAIYGARAANGVILITTKRGSVDRMEVNYSFNQGFSAPTRLPEMANSATYGDIRNEISYYNNPAGGLNQIYSEEEIQLFQNNTDPLNYPNTNWLDETLKPVTMQSRHNLSLRGGAEMFRYYVSAGYLKQDGLYRNGATNYNQYNIRSNIDVIVNENLDFGLTLEARREDRIYPQSSAGDIFRSAYRGYPTVSAYYPNGLPSPGIEGSNPVLMATDRGGTHNNPNNILNGMLTGSYILPFVKGFSIDGFISADQGFNFTKSFSRPYTVYEYNRSSGEFSERIIGDDPSMFQAQGNMGLVTANIKLNFDHQLWDDHQIHGFLGYEQSVLEEENFNATRMNFATPETPDLSQGGAASEDASNEGWSYRETRVNYLGRLNYNYRNKYMAEFQFRYDGSSIFPEGNQFGFFPSVSAAWRISSEPWFLNNVHVVDDLKLRASYGQLGNDRISAYQHLNSYIFDNRFVVGNSAVTGLSLNRLANPEVTWEVTEKIDIGIETTLFNRFYLEATVFNEDRDNILTHRSGSIPQVSGIVNPYGSSPLVPAENIGKVNNRGFEGLVEYSSSTNGLHYYLGGTFTYAKNEVIFLDEAPSTLPHQTQTGAPMGSALLYEAIGIFRTQDDLDNYPHVSGTQLGDLIYRDVNDDGQINADDRVRMDRSNMPEIIYGISMGGNWNNFDLSVLFQGQARVAQYLLPEGGEVGNIPSYWADNRWSPNNQDGSYPRLETRSDAAVSGGLYPSTFWLRNNAFIRLKNLELGYTITPDVLPGVNWRGARVFVNGLNLLTITKAEGYDPEGSDGSGQFYPQQRIVNIGFTVQF